MAGTACSSSAADSIGSGASGCAGFASGWLGSGTGTIAGVVVGPSTEIGSGSSGTARVSLGAKTAAAVAGAGSFSAGRCASADGSADESWLVASPASALSGTTTALSTTVSA